jgi:cytochrome b
MSSTHKDTSMHADQFGEPGHEVRVWDLPTRLFHWLLVCLVAISITTAMIGGLAMPYHEGCGVAILVLVLFRVMWGFMGGTQSRFTAFIRGPQEVLRYARALLENNAKRYIGHNPLGGWSIIAMLTALGVQAGTGLFANDDILTEGPLAHWVSKAISDSLTRIHLINKVVLMGLVVVHVSAVVFYLVMKRENLVTPMLTGCKRWPQAVENTIGHPALALVIMAATAFATYLTIYGWPQL